MAMQAVDGGTCWILLAALYPTFGKRGTGQRTKETTAAAESPATEQTPGTPTDTKVTVPNSQSSPSMQPSSSAVESGAATEHTAASGAATENTEDNDGDDKQADNQTEAISAATEHASKPKKQLR